MRVFRTSFVAALLVSLLPTIASAAPPTYFSSRAAFEAVVHNRVVDTYSNPGYVFFQSDAAMSAVLGETDYVSTGFNNIDIVNGGVYCAGCNGSFRLLFNTTSVTSTGGSLAAGVSGVGLDIVAHSASVPYYAFITFGDGSTANVALSTTPGFWGVTSDLRIASIHFGLSGGATTTGGAFSIDNLTIGGAACGNDVLEDGEVCDDGNLDPGDGCGATCVVEYCGNHVLDPGEVCDDGDTVSGDGCASDCLSDETCGNDVIDSAAGESCDDGGTDPGDGCGATCVIEYCGNTVLDPGEVCDVGDTMNGDGCASDCRSDETCGNGVVDVAVGEACDDGGTASGDGCQANCSLPTCGDGEIDAGEVCDDGGAVSGDGCNATCTSDESCGNGVVDPDEQCDDAGTDVGDGCGATCLVETCGNAVVDPGETCDVGDTLNGDGCASDCRSDETCGNGIVDVASGEACDDGNAASGDGCQATCALPSCGDATVDVGETCDDGNTASGDGCNATCTSLEVCGNGVVDHDELCDQGASNAETGPCGLECTIVVPRSSGGCGCTVATADPGARIRAGLLAGLVIATLLTRRRRRLALGAR